MVYVNCVIQEISLLIFSFNVPLKLHGLKFEART